MDLMKLMVRIGADTKDAEKGITNIKKMGNGLAKGLKTAAKGAGIALGAAATAVVALTKSAVDAYGKYEQLVGGIETLFGAGGKSLDEYAKSVGKTNKEAQTEYINLVRAQAKVLDNSKKAYKTAGMSANEYMETVTGFSASLIQSLNGNTVKAARLADQAIIDMSDNANKMGSDIENIKNAYAGFAKGNFTMLDNLKLGYGGTKEEMERLLKKAGEISGYKYDISSYADIVEAIHVVQEEMGITGTTAAEADKTIQGSLAATKAAWENVITAIGGGNLDLQDSIDALVESGINTINNIWPVVSNALSGIAELVKQVAPIIAENLPGMVEEILPKLLDAAITLLTGVANALPVLFQVVLDAIGKLFSTAMAYIEENNPELAAKIKAIAEFFVDAWNNMKAYWEDTLKPTLTTLWAFITDELVPAVKGAWDSFKTKVEAVFQVVANLWEQTLKPVLQALWDFIVKQAIPAIQGAWESLRTKIQTVFTVISNLWEQTLKPALQALWDFVVTQVVPAVQTAWDGLRTKIQSVFQVISNLWEQTLKPVFESIQAFVVDTVIPAVKDAWASAQTKISAVFAVIRNLWNGTLKPVFEAIGTFLVNTLKPAFSNTFIAIKNTVGIALGAISNLWNNTVKPIYDGIIAFFTGGFKGDWETAWEGLKGIVQGVWNAIQTAAETVWESAKLWGSTIVANFYLAFTNAWSIVKDSVTGAWNAIKNKAEELWTGAVTWAQTIIANFVTAFTNAWDLVKATVTGKWDDIKDKATELWNAAKNWGAYIVNNFKSSITNKWQEVKDGITGLFDAIPNAITSIVNKALTWGHDLIANFKQGISDKVDEFLEWFKSKIPGPIRDFIGFSVPKEGPLSDADTYMPDMIDLLVKGINDSAHLITTVMGNLVNNIKVAFKLAGEQGYSQFNLGLNGVKGKQLINAIKNPFEDAVDAIGNIKWKNLGKEIYEEVTYYTSWITDAFEDAFDFSHMYVKTPHWQVDDWYEISGTYYPEMSVRWYKKAYDNPVMFTQPTVLGTSGGFKGFGDGPGGEVVLSASKLRELVGTGGDTNITINAYQRDGENMDAFVRRIEETMARHEKQRKAAFA